MNSTTAQNSWDWRLKNKALQILEDIYCNPYGEKTVLAK